MVWDRLAGRPLEYDARNGAVVRASDRTGIPASCNRMVNALLAAVSGLPAFAAASRVPGLTDMQPRITNPPEASP
jgi:Ketopantoate reductase PanE/ApbA C terminal